MAKIRQKPGSKPVIPPGLDSFVIGNGTSRRDLPIAHLKDFGLVLACNWFFKDEFRPHVLVCSDEPISMDIQKNYSYYPRTNHMVTWYPKPGSGAKKATTLEKMAAGIMATWTAINDYNSPRVFLVGMDFFGLSSPKDHSNPDFNGTLNNMYAGKKHYAAPNGGAPTFRNWQRRFQYICRQFPEAQIWHVNPLDGKSPPRIVGFDNFHQCTWSDVFEHFKNGAPLVDRKVVTEDDIKLAHEPNPDDFRARVERQLAGQGNAIYGDVFSPAEFVNFRDMVIRDQKANPGQVLVYNIQGHQIPVYPGDAADA